MTRVISFVAVLVLDPEFFSFFFSFKDQFSSSL